MKLDRAFADRLYSLLLGRFGFRGWWPADTPFEVVVGAILTQQTSWSNTERAIKNLKEGGCMDLNRISVMNREVLEGLIRPSGYFRQKAARLQGLCRFISSEYGTLGSFFSTGELEMRRALLSQNGIGKETCDAIMLYAAGRPTFVVDAYTRRIVSRMLGLRAEPDYDTLQDAFQSAIEEDTELYKDMHAQLVELAKRNCTKRAPRCEACPALEMCIYGKRLRRRGSHHNN